MPYLFVFFIMYSLLCCIDLLKINKWSVLLFFLLGFSAIYIAIPGFQNGIGTDYYTYKSMYGADPVQLERIYNKGEYLFYFIYQSIISLNLGEQAIFIVTSLINSVFVFFTLISLKRFGFKASIVFFAFYFCTGIYHNQMNGIRQLMVTCMVPLLSILLWNRKYVFMFVLSVVMFFLHNTAAIVVFILLFARWIRGVFSLHFILFASSFLYLIAIPQLMDISIRTVAPSYIQYLQEGFLPPSPLVVIFSKMYYVPLLIWANILVSKYEKESSLVYFMMIIVNLTFFSFLSAFSYGFFVRFYMYFNFMLVIPIAYLIHHIKRSQNKIFIIIYIAIPYIAKIIFFPSGEYLFSSVVSNAL